MLYLFVVVLGTIGVESAFADDEPAVAEIPEAVPSIVESKALDFARKELAKLEARAAALKQAVDTAAANVANVDKTNADAVKTANDAKAAADKELAAIDPKIKAAAVRVELVGKAAPQADPVNFREVAQFKHNRPILSLRIDPSGDYVLAGAHDNLLQKWDLLSGVQQLVPGHRTWVGGMNFHPDGSLFVSGDHSGRVLWWNPADAEMKPLRETQAHKGYARAVSISPDKRFVATCGNDNLIRVWSVADGSLVKELPGHDRHVYNVAFDPTGRFLISGDLMGVIKQWDVSTWNHVRDFDCKVLTGFDKTFVADCGGIRGIDFSPDARTLVVCGISEVTNAFAGIGKPTAVTFNMETGERLKVMLPKDNFDGACWGVRYDPAGQFIVGAGGGGAGGMWFWKPGEDKSYHFEKMPAVAYDLCFHPDGLRLAVGFYDNTVRIYDLGPKPPAPPAAPAKK